MKRRLLLAGSLALIGVALMAGRWDGAFQRVGTIRVNSSGASLNAGKGAYVKVECVLSSALTTANDAYVGVGLADAGCAPQADAGYPCSLVRYSLGEKFYQQMQDVQSYVAVYSPDAGLDCNVFKATP